MLHLLLWIKKEFFIKINLIPKNYISLIYLTNWRRTIIIIPIRCFSCGKLIAHAYQPYLELIEKGERAYDAFKQLGIERNSFNWDMKK